MNGERERERESESFSFSAALIWGQIFNAGAKKLHYHFQCISHVHKKKRNFPTPKLGVFMTCTKKEREKMGVKGLAVVYEIAFDKHCSDPKRSGVIATTGFPFRVRALL